MDKYGVYVGRINPLHLGHEAVAGKMLKMFGSDNSLMVIGSSTAPFSLRHFFSYEERENFAKKIFPNLKVVGLPDYPTDKEWLIALDDILFANGFDLERTVFFGGCKEDVSFFIDAGRECHIIDRFDGTTPVISATEIRERLVDDQSIGGMVNSIIEDEVRTLFAEKQKKFGDVL